MPAEGIHFIPSSENAELDANVYGTTFVNEAFVRATIAGLCGPDHPYVRIKRGLANEQDLYVVPRSRQCALERLAAFRKGAWGWVDECRVSGDSELYLRGWAASVDDGALVRLLQRCVTDDDARRILVDNPAKLYDFD